MSFGTGWYPPEGGRRRQWTWTSGEAVRTWSPAARTIRFDLGRPGMTVPLEITVEHGAARRDLHRGQRSLGCSSTPSSAAGRELRFPSKTMCPARRTPARSASRCPGCGWRPGGSGPREVIAHRFPWLLRDPSDKAFLGAYDTVMANTEYTRGWIRGCGRPRPRCSTRPSRSDRMHPAAEREKAVLTVGRFFEPGPRPRQAAAGDGADLRPDGRRRQAGRLVDTVVGGCEESQRPYLEPRCGRRRGPAGRGRGQRPAVGRGAGHVDRVDLLVGDRARRGRGAPPWARSTSG